MAQNACHLSLAGDFPPSLQSDPIGIPPRGRTSGTFDPEECSLCSGIMVGKGGIRGGKGGRGGGAMVKRKRDGGLSCGSSQKKYQKYGRGKDQNQERNQHGRRSDLAVVLFREQLQDQTRKICLICYAKTTEAKEALELHSRSSSPVDEETESGKENGDASTKDVAVDDDHGQGRSQSEDESEEDVNEVRVASGEHASVCPDPFKTHLERLLVYDEIKQLVQAKQKFNCKVPAPGVQGGSWISNTSAVSKGI